MTWWIWWLLGVEQFLPALVILGLAPFYLGNWRRQRLHLVVFAAVLVAVWWVVPIIRVERLDSFVRITALVGAQAAVVAGFAMGMHTPREREQVVAGLRWFALAVAVACLVYALGVWRGSLQTPVGLLVGATDSVFFSDISERSFGRPTGTLTDWIPFRLHGLSLRSTDLSLVGSLLLFFIFAYPFRNSWLQRITVVGLVLGVVFAQVRVAYGGVLLGLLLMAGWRVGFFARGRLGLTLGVVMGAVGVGILGTYWLFDVLQAGFEVVFIESRSGSWYARRTIYTTTLELLPQHPISGWGESVRIEGRPTNNSAGTHSDVLQVLFQHGVVGLMFYSLLWLAVWRHWWRAIRDAVDFRAIRTLAFLGVGLLIFQLQNFLSAWQWDHSTMFVVWVYWGLIISYETQGVYADESG